MSQRYEKDNVPTDEDTLHYSTALQRLLRRSGQVDTARSLGEALLPFLLAAAEACWFDAILIGLAGVDFLHVNTALLPFWAPPLLICTALWLFQRVLLREACGEKPGQATEGGAHTPSGFGLLFGVLALLDAGLIWFRIYAGSNFLLDPRWLLNFVGDLLLLDGRFYQALAIIIFTIYFCWRGTKLAQMRIEPGHAWRQTWVGLLILLAAILLRAGDGRTSDSFDDIVLLLLLPAFLYFVLSAHALARISFVRRAHPFGLEGSIVAQERAMLSVVGGVGLLMLILTLLGGVFFSSAFFNSLQPMWQVLAGAYNWLVNALSLLLAWLLTPVFWLVSWISTLAHNPHAKPQPATITGLKNGHPLVSPTMPDVIFATRVILPFLILLGLCLLLWYTLRRRKRLRITRNNASGDVHESVWSWALFWRQFVAFLAALFRRHGAADAPAEYPPGGEDLPAEPAARTIREIYRALLKKAAALGYVRRRHETAYEFQQRLNRSSASHNEPQLGQLTDAYTLTRYGGAVPDEFDLASTRRSWEELEQKWQALL